MTEKDFERAEDISLIIGSCKGAINRIRKMLKDGFPDNSQFQCLGEDFYFALDNNPRLEKALITMLEEEIQYREEERRIL